MGEECVEFRTKALAIKDQLPEVNVFCNGSTWTMVQEKLDAEKEARDHWKKEKRGSAPVMEMTTAVNNASHAIGTDLENILYAIRLYATRKEKMHSKVSVHIKECDWQKLVVQLYRDIHELKNVFGDEEYKKMSKALNTIKERYFLSLDDPYIIIESPEANGRAYRRKAEIIAKELRRQENERKEVEARERREKREKQTKDNSDDEEVLDKQRE